MKRLGTALQHAFAGLPGLLSFQRSQDATDTSLIPVADSRPNPAEKLACPICVAVLDSILDASGTNGTQSWDLQAVPRQA
jgi:hypothetical protein